MSTGRKKLVLDGGVDDAICGLPRHVLDKIIACLPVRDAARMSILSRKWRYLWSACPYLVFDQQFFKKTFANKSNSPNKYVNVIHKVLLGHDGPVLDFDLHIPDILYDWDEHIDQWLLFLSRNGIQKLHLDCRCPTPYKLPSYVFCSPKLTNLMLKNVIFKPPISFSGFANLVNLYFYRVTFAACVFNGVLHAAPLLKELTFSDCTGVEHFSISAPQAMSISIYYSTEVTPIFFDKFPKLDCISIFIEPMKCCPMNLSEFHEKFSRVKVIRFSACYLQLSAATTIERRLSFVFLRSLALFHLSFDDLDQSSCALWLLNSSPNLENFVVSVSPSKGTAVESILNHLESPDCMSKMLNLRLMKLVSIVCSKPELLFIKCILANSPNLESLYVIYGAVNRDQQLRISNELMRFPRASNKAEVICNQYLT